MHRRSFLSLLGTSAAASVWPLAVRGQQDGRVRRIGLLGGGRLALLAFMQALAGLGWTDGRNVRIYLRGFGDDINQIRERAQELLGLQPDVIVTNSTVATVVVQRETRTIPIVFAGVIDPVVT